jgi:hypothetical protein
MQASPALIRCALVMLIAKTMVAWKGKLLFCLTEWLSTLQHLSYVSSSALNGTHTHTTELTTVMPNEALLDVHLEGKKGQ